MGECCSKSTNDQQTELKTLDTVGLQKRFTMRQIQLIIKIQANFRGMMTRKKVRNMQYQMGRSGMGVGGNFGQMLAENGDIMQDYNNEKVQVSTKHIFFSSFLYPIANKNVTWRIRLQSRGHSKQ